MASIGVTASGVGIIEKTKDLCFDENNPNSKSDWDDSDWLWAEMSDILYDEIPDYDTRLLVAEYIRDNCEHIPITKAMIKFIYHELE